MCPSPRGGAETLVAVGRLRPSQAGSLMLSTLRDPAHVLQGHTALGIISDQNGGAFYDWKHSGLVARFFPVGGRTAAGPSKQARRAVLLRPRASRPAARGPGFPGLSGESNVAFPVALSSPQDSPTQLLSCSISSGLPPRTLDVYQFGTDLGENNFFSFFARLSQPHKDSPELFTCKLIQPETKQSKTRHSLKGDTCAH